MRWPQNNSIASTKHPFHHTLATVAETHVLFIRRGFQQPVDFASKPNYNPPPSPIQHHPLGGIHFIDPANRENKDGEGIKVINWAYVNAASLGWKLKSGAIRCSQSNEALCADLPPIRSAAHSSLFSSYLSIDLTCEDITLPSHGRQLRVFTPTLSDGHTSCCLQVSK